MISPDLLNKHLRNLAFMFDLDDALKPWIVSAIKDASKTLQLPPETPLISVDDEPNDLGYVLLDGQVEISSGGGFSRRLDPPVLLGDMKQFHFELSNKRMASVHTVTSVTVLQFTWADLYDRLSTSISESELAMFRSALQDHAWMHYLEIQDEL